MPLVEISLEVYQVNGQLLYELVAELALIQLQVVILHIIDRIILYELLYKCLLLSAFLLHDLIHNAPDFDDEFVRLLASQLFRVL